jgi:hypothetical protein
MRRLVLVAIVIACAACSARAPRTPGLRITIPIRAEIRAQAVVEVVQAPVELQGATVVEFFGIPLEDAQDVVFVLDRSGSMSDPAQGRLAEIVVTDPSAAALPPGPPTSPPPPPPDGASPPPPPPPDPTMTPPPDAPPVTPAAPVAAPVAAPRKIDVALAELADALRRLPPGTRLNVVFFNDELEAFAPTMVSLDDAGREGLVGFVYETTPTGRTALTPAMRLAFLMNARRIVLLSDGLGNVGGNASVLLRDAREAVRGGVRIDTIGIGRDQDGSLLQTLAAESGGIYQPL